MWDFKDKKSNVKELNNYMLTRTLAMFEWIDLPETIPPHELERQLQSNGFSFITEISGELYALTGTLGGQVDAYGNPTEIIITNVGLDFNKTLNIENDGVLIKNDDLRLGLLNLYRRYNTLIVENEITMFLDTYNTRIQTLISAGDDSTKESAELYLQKIINGDLGIIAEDRLFDGVKAQTSTNSTGNHTTQLIELQQYLKASLFNEVGLNANFNMKRERLNSSEVDMNTEQLRPFIDNMRMNRQQATLKLNEKYDLSVGVDFGSIWKLKDDDAQQPVETSDGETIGATDGETLGEDVTIVENETGDIVGVGTYDGEQLQLELDGEEDDSE